MRGTCGPASVSEWGEQDWVGGGVELWQLQQRLHLAQVKLWIWASPSEMSKIEVRLSELSVQLSLKRRCNLGWGRDLPPRAIQLWAQQTTVSAAGEWEVAIQWGSCFVPLEKYLLFMRIRHPELQNLEFQELEALISKERKPGFLKTMISSTSPFHVLCIFHNVYFHLHVFNLVKKYNCNWFVVDAGSWTMTPYVLKMIIPQQVAAPLKIHLIVLSGQQLLYGMS